MLVVILKELATSVNPVLLNSQKYSFCHTSRDTVLKPLVKIWLKPGHAKASIVGFALCCSSLNTLRAFACRNRAGLGCSSEGLPLYHCDARENEHGEGHICFYFQEFTNKQVCTCRAPGADECCAFSNQGLGIWSLNSAEGLLPEPREIHGQKMSLRPIPTALSLWKLT